MTHTRVGSTFNIDKIGPDTVSYIALAVQHRLQKLIQHMIMASKHRANSQSFTQPPVSHGYKIVDIQDIKKQLLAIERVEREEERKRREMIAERDRRAQMGEGENEGGDDDKPSKKKKKKEMGPGVTARYMSDDVRNKTTNETALMIAGGVRKSWMLTGMMKDKQGRQTAPPPQLDAPSPTSHPEAVPEEQPRGRGRPRRRKSGSGPDLMAGKKVKGFIPRGPEGLFLPPSTIGRPHRLGEQGARKITLRDALYVLEDEYENKQENATRTLLKAYSYYLK